METGRMSREDYSWAVSESKRTGRSLHDLLLSQGKVSVDELVQAITIHLDITLLKEALGMEAEKSPPISGRSTLPLGSYLERISMLFKTSALMSSQKNVSSLVDMLIREAPSVMNAQRATIFLADPVKKELYVHMGVGLNRDQIRIPWDSGIAGWVYSRGAALNIADPYSDPRFNREADAKTGFLTRNILCVPLRSPRGPILGVFQVLNKRAGVFTSIDQEILEILSSQAARAIETAVENHHPGPRQADPSEESLDLLRDVMDSKPLEDILGESESIQEIRATIAKVAKTDTTVLIQGESGTGKELVARAIQQLSPRKDGPYTMLNCAAVPSELIESELFGHKKGSFTGAYEDHAGVFQYSDNGTLFLDEIEAMSPGMQVKLLRAIQSGEIKPVGSSSVTHVDVRLIAATNKDLGELVGTGDFREDLFYRINVFPINIPPLRDRQEDIPLLARHFIHELALKTGKNIRNIDPAAIDLLMRHPWPGNVRELENELERAHVVAPPGATISVGSLSNRLKRSVEKIIDSESSTEGGTLKEAVEDLERSMIKTALANSGGNRSVAAKSLGLSRQGLINKIKKYGFPHGD
jgi:Nif-specific regulatory protein